MTAPLSTWLEPKLIDTVRTLRNDAIADAPTRGADASLR